MRLHAELRRKQSEIQDENCIVTDIIELPESEYASLYQNLLRERDYLAERANMESFIDGQRCCVLVLGEGQEDGILVDSQGSSYARRSAFIPEARTLVRNHIRQLADYVVSEGTEHTEDGRWANTYRDDNSSLVLVLPYARAEYLNNEESYHDYYSDVEISYAASKAHPKAAIQIRNREMVERADLILCCIEREKGGAWQTVRYAMKQGKDVINLANDDEAVNLL